MSDTAKTETTKSGAAKSGAAEVSGKTDRSRREELSEEEGFLRRSLEDLDRERDAGDLDTADYEALRSRYVGRSQAIEAARKELDELDARAPAQATERSPAVQPRRPGVRGWLSSGRHRLVMGWSAVACFALAGTLVGLALAGVTPFTQSPPLSAVAQIRIELGEAGALAQDHNVVQAVAVYDKVLELDPEQPEALADSGWLVRLAGLSSKSSQLITGGDAEIASAVKVAPGYALARAYDAVALYQDQRSAAAAVRELRAMLADHPSPALLYSVRTPALAAFRTAGIAAPTALVSAEPPMSAGG